MSQKREKRKRRERRREYALELRCWQNNEPPKIFILALAQMVSLKADVEGWRTLEREGHVEDVL